MSEGDPSTSPEGDSFDWEASIDWEALGPVPSDDLVDWDDPRLWPPEGGALGAGKSRASLRGVFAKLSKKVVPTILSPLPEKFAYLPLQLPNIGGKKKFGRERATLSKTDPSYYSSSISETPSTEKDMVDGEDVIMQDSLNRGR